MAQCPICQKQVQASFGMILCPKCQTPLFFDFDGNPQVGDTVSDPPSVELESIQNLEANFLNEKSLIEKSNHHEEQNQMNEENQAYESERDGSFEESIDEIIQEPESPNAYQEASDTYAEVNQEVADDEEFDLESPVSSETNANLEFTDDNGSSTNGQFFYDIEIEGIDGSKLRNELYDELKDPRWGWIAIELMGKINMGRLILKNVNAVKASLLINRLKALPLEIKWKQNVDI